MDKNLEKNFKEDCIFCKIVNGELPSTTVYEDENVKVIENIKPVCSTHLLVIPKAHTDNLMEYEGNDLELGKVFNAAKKVADKLSLDSYRVVVNVGEDAGQSVMHTHVHILNDKSLKENFI